MVDEAAGDAKKGEEEHCRRWAKSIGVDDSVKTLADYGDLKYNNPPRYALLQGYARAVKKGDISPLVGFKRYEEVDADVQKRLVGVKTSTGVTIESYATHFIDRVIGQTSTDYPGMRCGVSIDDVIDALTTPGNKIKERVMGDGDVRHTFTGHRVSVTISLRDRRIIQTNPRRGE